MLVTVAGYVGLVVVAARLLTYLSKYLRSPLKVTKLGDWALVTGATDGIGESYSAEPSLLTKFENCTSLLRVIQTA